LKALAETVLMNIGLSRKITKIHTTPVLVSQLRPFVEKRIEFRNFVRDKFVQGRTAVTSLIKT